MKSQNKTKSKSQPESDTPKADGTPNKLKLVLRLSASEKEGEKRWTIGNTNEAQKEEKLPPIRINTAKVLKSVATGEEGKQRRSPRSKSPNGEKEAKRLKVVEEKEEPKRTSTRVRKSTENKDEYLFDPAAEVPRSKRKRKEGNGSAMPSSPIAETKRSSKRVRKSLPTEEFDEQTAVQEDAPESPRKKKLSPRQKKVKDPATTPQAAEGETVTKKLLPLKKVLTIMLNKLIRKDTYLLLQSCNGGRSS